MDNAIAIIGIDCKFPGANNKDEYWELLKNGLDVFDKKNKNSKRLNYGILPDIDKFDAEFFGITPNDARFMDPQQRLFLESSWRVIEDAGYNSAKLKGRTGIFAGEGISTYLINSIIPYVLEKKEEANKLIAQIFHGNSCDYLTSRVAYHLDLKGPSVSIQTACSSALAAVHYACQSLLLYECDLAISGGVSVISSQDSGYEYRKGDIFSQSGICSPFSEDGDGTVFSSGVGTVLLKRYEDAVESCDNIYAIIRGSAVGNDGALKASYMSPNIEGQKDVINLALDIADVDVGTISYIETHGTGTEIGDKIEIQALWESEYGGKDCLIGSVKGNIGHTLAASGIAGLIKTVLCIKQGILCPSANCKEEMSLLKDTSFGVIKEVKKWDEKDQIIRAGVSSFGMGGTNAHLILEKYSDDANSGFVEDDNFKYLKLSAKSNESLQKLKSELMKFLENKEVSLIDLAYTYENRCEFSIRKMICFRDKQELLAQLKSDMVTYELEDISEIVLTEKLEKNNFYKTIVENINYALLEKKSGTKILKVETEEALCCAIKMVWEKGICFEIPYEGKKRISAPTYQFQKHSYWIQNMEILDNEKNYYEKEGKENVVEYIRQKWKGVLGVEEIFNNQDFFEIGGYSLLAIQIISELEDEYGISIPIEEILDEPTIINMSKIVTAQMEMKEE